MKPIIVVYATREGHTEQIATQIRERLARLGRTAVLRDVRDVGDAPLFGHYDAAILASSVHAGQHEKAMARFVKEHRSELTSMPTAFVSVSLSEAAAEGHAPDAAAREKAGHDVAGLLDRFYAETDWHPDRAQPVAGALAYSQYGLLRRLVMKRIAKKMGAPTDTSRDYDYTDWEALDRFVDDLVASLRAPAREAAAG